jgi:hypothetical protein
MPNAKTRLALGVAQGACALACFILTLSWLVRFSFQPGIVMALIGSALLIYGALERFPLAVKPDSTK